MKLFAKLTDMFRKKTTIHDLISQSKEQWFGLVLMILALPSALPIPAPWYSIPFGVAIMFVAGQILIWRRQLRVPDRIGRITLPRTNDKAHSLMTRFLSFIWRLIKHRGAGILTPMTYRLLSLIIVLCGASMCIPIPGTNTIPALGVFLIAVGMAEKDSIITTLGALLALAGVTLTGLILRFGPELVKATIKNTPHLIESASTWIQGLF